MDKVGRLIRTAREKKGLSQENMAVELGISQPAYARLEKKDTRISVPRLIQIASVLETNTSKLLNQDDQNNDTKSETELIKALKEEIIFLRKLLKQIKVNNK